jgi:hypothetical protein
MDDKKRTKIYKKVLLCNMLIILYIIIKNKKFMVRFFSLFFIKNVKNVFVIVYANKINYNKQF